jgi:hypothetical protein
MARWSGRNIYGRIYGGPSGVVMDVVDIDERVRLVANLQSPQRFQTASTFFVRRQSRLGVSQVRLGRYPNRCSPSATIKRITAVAAKNTTPCRQLM